MKSTSSPYFLRFIWRSAKPRCSVSGIEVAELCQV